MSDVGETGELSDARRQAVRARLDEKRKLRELYRRTFSGPFGRQVLAHMLVELGHFNTVAGDPKEVALQNYAKRVLNILGVWDAGQVENVVANLLDMPVQDRTVE